MTREEAIDVLSDFRKFTLSILGKSIYAERCSAIDMAIEALSKPIVDITQRDLCEDISCTDCPFMKETCKLMDYVAYAEAAQGWIPCSERLPEKDDWVLVTKRGKVRIATYSEFDGTWYVGEMCAVGGEDPIAWKPLPKPYREDGEEWD